MTSTKRRSLDHHYEINPAQTTSRPPIKKQKSFSEVVSVFDQINVGSPMPSVSESCKNVFQEINNDSTEVSTSTVDLVPINLFPMADMFNADLSFKPDVSTDSVLNSLNQTLNESNGESHNNLESFDNQNVGETDGISEDLTEVDGKVTQLIPDLVTSFVDGIGNKIHQGIDTLTHQDSVEETPENDVYHVYVPHPTLGKADMLPVGMLIQQMTGGNIEGHRVHMVEEGTLAEQFQLRKNDVLIEVEDKSIEKSSHIEVIEIFGSLSETFSITLLRQETNEKGVKEFQCIKLTVEISTDGNDVISVTIVDVKATQYYKYTNSRYNVVIAQQTRPTDVTRYLKTDNKSVTMETQFNDKCLFTINFYNARFVCTVCNVTNTQSLSAAKSNRDDGFRIAMANGRDLTKNYDKLRSDDRFFYIQQTGNSNEYAFESITHKDYYMTFEDEMVKVKLQKKSLKQLPREFRFTTFAYVK